MMTPALFVSRLLWLFKVFCGSKEDCFRIVCSIAVKKCHWKFIWDRSDPVDCFA